MPAWRCTEEGERGAVCCTPDTDQQEPEQLGPREFMGSPHSRGRDPHDCVPAPVFSPRCSLFSFHFPPLKPSTPCAGAGPWVAIKHTGFFGSAERHGPLMCPRAATLRPSAFQRPVLGYCVHILSLFVHLPEGPSPAAPLPQPQPP